MISSKDLQMVTVDVDVRQGRLLLLEPAGEHRLVRVQAAVPRHLPPCRARPAAAGRLACRDCEALVGGHVC